MLFRIESVLTAGRGGSWRGFIVSQFKTDSQTVFEKYASFDPASVRKELVNADSSDLVHRVPIADVRLGKKSYGIVVWHEVVQEFVLWRPEFVDCIEELGVGSQYSVLAASHLTMDLIFGQRFVEVAECAVGVFRLNFLLSESQLKQQRHSGLFLAEQASYPCESPAQCEQFFDSNAHIDCVCPNCRHLKHWWNGEYFRLWRADDQCWLAVVRGAGAGWLDRPTERRWIGSRSCCCAGSGVWCPCPWQ